MALTVQSILELQKYVKGALERAGHHAPLVDKVSLALLGAIVWRADRQIAVREYAGNPANMMWFQINSSQYAMLYNHQTGKIELNFVHKQVKPLPAKADEQQQIEFVAQF